MPKCPNCNVPGEQHLVFVDGVKDGKHCGWQQYELCHTCGGTNEISEERVRWMEEGKRLHRERVARRESLKEMSERIGIDYCRLSRIEAGIEPMPEVNCG